MKKYFSPVFEDRLSSSEIHKTVAIIGSGPAAPTAHQLLGPTTIVWVINNAWRAVPKYDALIYSDDLPLERKPDAISLARLGRSSPQYYPAMVQHGGILFCGATMALAAGYMAIEAFPFSQIAFYASDMTYDSAPSHFYGEGSADPLRHDISLQDLDAKCLRLFYMGLERGCLVVNASSANISRLAIPHPKNSAFLRVNVMEDLKQPLINLLDTLRPLADAALKIEAQAEFDAGVYDYGRYMKENAVWEYVRRVDAAWALMKPAVRNFSDLLTETIKAKCEAPSLIRQPTETA